jgi:hypothetical protein
MDEAKKDILVITEEEIRRYQVIRKIFDQDVNQQEAAEYLGLSDRQVRRIVHRVRKEGERGVIHRLRGARGCRRFCEGFKSKVLSLYRNEYRDFGPTLASEKLLERQKVEVSDETLRLWLIEAGLWHIRRQRKPKERTWRKRKDHWGEMIQMDGSHHDWLEGRGPKLVLMGYIDDATGRFYGRFYDYEGTLPAMGSLKAYIRLYGIPRSIYLDKHSTYKNNHTERYVDWPFRDKEELTQFARASKQLGIEIIHAHSPQAKGRVERVFKTLQDRLVKELRLADAKTCQEANAVLGRYLDPFNRKFRVEAPKKGDWHRPLDPKINLDEILSVQTKHFLRNDRTVVHKRRWFQVLTRTRAQEVTIHEYLSGRMAIKSGNARLVYQPIQGPMPRAQEAKKPQRARPHRYYVPCPSDDHPWRRSNKAFYLDQN